MRKKALRALMASALCISMVTPVLASNTTGSKGGAIPTPEGTDVLAGIVLYDENMDARFLVEVPTIFGFVVNGTLDAGITTGVSSTDGTILLPNMLVKIKDGNVSGTLPGGAGNSAKYEVVSDQSGIMKFRNYSTKVADPATNPHREGMEVDLVGYVDEGATKTAKDKNYWSHVNNADVLAANPSTDGFKKYTLELGKVKFDTPMNGWFGMGKGITLEGPDLGWNNVGGAGAQYTNMNKDTELAITGKEADAELNVYVGGFRSQYKQVEESAKIGTICWQISAEITPDQPVYTAPDNEYLDGKASGEANDPDAKISGGYQY